MLTSLVLVASLPQTGAAAVTVVFSYCLLLATTASRTATTWARVVPVGCGVACQASMTPLRSVSIPYWARRPTTPLAIGTHTLGLGGSATAAVQSLAVRSHIV